MVQPKTIQDVLEHHKDGKLSTEMAVNMLKGSIMGEIENVATLDLFRELRAGVPEVVFAESKGTDDLLRIVDGFLATKGSCILSRVTAAQVDALQKAHGDKIAINEKARMVIVHGEREASLDKPPRGSVGIITAGTSDIMVAEEAAVICEEMGCEVMKAYDIGIAGIHRVFKPLRSLVEAGVDAIICCAGMEGALPSVVASLVDVIVIGVPVSVGYGFGGKGKTALQSMLQSCSPGLLVVNIDNGIGAGAAAALIARRAARK